LSAVKEHASAPKSKGKATKINDDTSLWIEKALIPLSDSGVYEDIYADENVMISKSVGEHIPRTSTIGVQGSGHQDLGVDDHHQNQ
jgi:hypothetical protein